VTIVWQELVVALTLSESPRYEVLPPSPCGWWVPRSAAPHLHDLPPTTRVLLDLRLSVTSSLAAAEADLAAPPHLVVEVLDERGDAQPGRITRARPFAGLAAWSELEANDLWWEAAAPLAPGRYTLTSRIGSPLITSSCPTYGPEVSPHGLDHVVTFEVVTSPPPFDFTFGVRLDRRALGTFTYERACPEGAWCQQCGSAPDVWCRQTTGDDELVLRGTIAIRGPVVGSPLYHRGIVRGVGFGGPRGIAYAEDFYSDGTWELALERAHAGADVDSLPIGLELEVFSFAEQRRVATAAVSIPLTEPIPTAPALACDLARCAACAEDQAACGPAPLPPDPVLVEPRVEHEADPAIAEPDGARSSDDDGCATGRPWCAGILLLWTARRRLTTAGGRAPTPA